jgi:uncharacterized protein
MHSRSCGLRPSRLGYRLAPQGEESAAAAFRWHLRNPHPEVPVEGGPRRRRFALALSIAVLCVLLALPALAQPKLPPLTGRVVDLANVLSPVQEAALTEQLAAHEARTSNQVVVATVPSLQGYDLERFAVDLARDWKLGQANRNNGVLLLVALEERRVRIEVGYGLEGALTDALSSDIINSRIRPRFRAGDLPGGITSGVDGILAVIEGTYKPIATPHPEDRVQALAPFLMVLAWIILVMILNSRSGRRRRVWGTGLPGVWIGGPGGFGGRSGGFGGGFGRGGGGFSGGGGSSGGGGASGRW